MLKLIQFLFYGHFHTWKIIGEHRVLPPSGGDIPFAIDYVLQCEKCGDIKKVRT